MISWDIVSFRFFGVVLGDEGARTAARLQLALVCVVVIRWSLELFVFFLLFWGSLYTTGDY
jgi:hypothetical protein